MFGYQLFVPLSLKGVEERRDRLDQAGFTSWLSPIFILTFLYLIQIVKRYAPLRLRQSTGKAPNILLLYTRRVSWLLSTPLPSDFGDIKTHVIGILYASWLLYLAVRDTAPDYMHVTKSLSHVAVSQLPLHYLLAFKSPNSPVQILTGLAHERINAYHRLLGRIIHMMLATHAILYLNFFIQAGVLAKRIKDTDVRLGIAAFWTINILGALALPVIRRKAYHRLFYRSHAIIPAVLLVLLWFHVRYTRVYVAQAALFWVANGLLRNVTSSSQTLAKIERLEGSSLLRLTLPVPPASALNEFLPGEHVYLKNISSVFGPKTPFTIVDIEKTSEKHGNNNSSPELMLVVRDLGGPQTGRLAMLAEQSSPAALAVEGPYGEAREYMPPLLENAASLLPNVLLFAGGVGATYALPIYIALLKERQFTRGLKLIWIVKTRRDAAWGIELLGNMRNLIDVELYLTQRKTTNNIPLHPEIERQVPGLQVEPSRGRPDLREIVRKCLSSSNAVSASRGVVSSAAKSPTRAAKQDYSPFFVGVCGPPGLAKAVRIEVGRHVYDYGRDIQYHEEQFGFGAS